MIDLLDEDKNAAYSYSEVGQTNTSPNKYPSSDSPTSYAYSEPTPTSIGAYSDPTLEAYKSTDSPTAQAIDSYSLDTKPNVPKISVDQSEAAYSDVLQSYSDPAAPYADVLSSRQPRSQVRHGIDCCSFC